MTRNAAVKRGEPGIVTITVSSPVRGVKMTRDGIRSLHPL